MTAVKAGRRGWRRGADNPLSRHRPPCAGLQPPRTLYRLTHQPPGYTNTATTVTQLRPAAPTAAVFSNTPNTYQ